MDTLEEKYIDLLLNRCINFGNSESLFISFEKSDIRSCNFVDKLVTKSKELGITDIYMYDENSVLKHDILKQITITEIDNNPMFNRSIWDEYAKKGSSFIILKTELPGLMDDVDDASLAHARYVERITCPIYKKLQGEYKIPWCIAVFPSERWARALFPNADNAYDRLFKLICSIVMVDTEDPIVSWNNLLESNKKIVNKLDSLKISKLFYRNSLGTNFSISLNKEAIWECAGYNGMIVNMPTYEIFTTPDFRTANGIVYGSRPLCYNGGIIENFYLEFKDGKVINYDAKVGLDILKGIIESDEYSSYLGEVALVDCNSPIYKTNMLFNDTLLDENASCHLALGSGFPNCIRNGDKYNINELFNMGVNPSKNHTDFMIGTNDLNIEAKTNKGKILIFKNGKFNI